jgi:hypothetical protein
MVCACITAHIHDQGVTKMVPGLVVDQRSRGEAYINFSQPNPSHSIDKEHQGKNTSRTARTGE